MPTFMQIKRWIREAARDIGTYVSEKESKALAGAYMTACEPDPELRISSLTYNDSTGERAVKEWFKAVSR